MGDGSAPKRIQRRRAKGWRQPANAVYVGRPTRWGNPYVIGEHSIGSAAQAVECFRTAVEHIWPATFSDRVQAELAGRDLMCWCPLTGPDGEPWPCHADILLRIASGEDI